MLHGQVGTILGPVLFSATWIPSTPNRGHKTGHKIRQRAARSGTLQSVVLDGGREQSAASIDVSLLQQIAGCLQQTRLDNSTGDLFLSVAALKGGSPFLLPKVFPEERPRPSSCTPFALS